MIARVEQNNEIRLRLALNLLIQLVRRSPRPLDLVQLAYCIIRDLKDPQVCWNAALPEECAEICKARPKIEFDPYDSKYYDKL